MRRRPLPGPQRDRGSVLVLVLVLMVVVGLMVVPMLSHSTSVFRANRVLSEKTRRQEAVKAGVRLALAEPNRLYDWCFNQVNIAGGALVEDVNIQCRFRGESAAFSDEKLHIGLAATRVGAAVPTQLAAVPNPDCHDHGTPIPGCTPLRIVRELGATETSWMTDGSTSKRSLPQELWFPNVPTRPTAERPAEPYLIGGTNDPALGWCQVYFPGTYTEPVTLTGRVYFVSGIYYFEDVLTVTGQADVVVGQGKEVGCTNDQEALFYAGVLQAGVWQKQVPQNHGQSGAGATFVLGKNGRFVVTNRAVGSIAAGAPKIRFNQRQTSYKVPDQISVSYGVSIISVNGSAVEPAIEDPGLPAGPANPNRRSWTPAPHADPAQAGALTVPGIYEVPMSRVGGVGIPQHYLDPENPGGEYPRPICGPTDDPTTGTCVAEDVCLTDEVPDGDPAIPCAQTLLDVGYIPSELTYETRPQRGTGNSTELLQWAPRNVAAGAFEIPTSGTRPKGVYVTWDEPERVGGLPIEYNVTVTRSGTPIGSCTSGDASTNTAGGRECLVVTSNAPSPAQPSAGTPYVVTVTAQNSLDVALGQTSVASPAFNVTNAQWSASPTAPSIPGTLNVVSLANGTYRLEWANANPGSTRVVAYEVQAVPVALVNPLAPTPTPASLAAAINVPTPITDPVAADWSDQLSGATWPVLPNLDADPDPEWHYTFSGLDPAWTYRFGVVAKSLIPTWSPGLPSVPMNVTSSAPSYLADGAAALAPIQSASLAAPPAGGLPATGFTYSGCNAAATYDPALPSSAYSPTNLPGCAEWNAGGYAPRAFEPMPIVDIDLGQPSPATGIVISIPGYIAVPQGVFRLYDPSAIAATSSGDDQVAVSGGILAASYRVRLGGALDTGLTAAIGLSNPPVLRTFAICSTTTSGRPEVRSVAVVQIHQSGQFQIASEVTESFPDGGPASGPCQ